MILRTGLAPTGRNALETARPRLPLWAGPTPRADLCARGLGDSWAGAARLRGIAGLRRVVFVGSFDEDLDLALRLEVTLKIEHAGAQQRGAARLAVPALLTPSLQEDRSNQHHGSSDHER
jgi:hypothetical protein